METINSAASIRVPWKEASAVRNHGTHPGCSVGLDKEIGVEFRGFPVPKPNSGITHLSTRQYARIVDSWVQLLGLDTTSYGTHTLRRSRDESVERAGPAGGSGRPIAVVRPAQISVQKPTSADIDILTSASQQTMD